MYIQDQSRFDALTEDDKLSEKYLQAQIASTINSISSINKQRVIDAYNVRNGVRDIKDFEYLWAAYGIEFPAQLRHIPVLRVIFDSLVGQYMNRPFKWQITATDSESVNFMFEEYRDEVLATMERYYVSRVRAATFEANSGSRESEKAKKFIADMKAKYESGSFQSSIEILAKKMVTWAIRRFKLKSILTDMVNDYATTGETYYQVKVLAIGQKPLIRAINPAQLFVHKPTNVKFVKDCERVVYREKMTVTEIWNKFGHMMKDEDAEKFLSDYNRYVLDKELEIVGYEFGTLAPGNPDTHNSTLTTPELNVDYVEWKDNVKIPMDAEDSALEGKPQDKLEAKKKRYKYRLDLFEGYRIGDCFYVGMGRNKFADRDPDDPSNVSLTINGTWYNDRNGEPYSLPLKTKDIADKIDILHYHAEAMIAMSGTKAVTVDVNNIPAFIQGTPVQKIMKWLGYLKQGMNLIDSSQDGFGKFQQGGGSQDMTLTSALDQIYRAADNLEGTAYRITGVSRQTVGNITSSDGKGTTEMAIQGSEVVTQSFFGSFDELAEQFMSDVANACRVAYKEGKVGSYVLGEAGQQFFSYKHKQFPLAFLNVHMSNSGEEERDLDAVRVVAQQLIEAGLVDAETAVDTVTLKSLTELKKTLKAATAKTKEDNTQEMQGQLEQYQSELQKLNKQVEAAQKKEAQNGQLELQLKQQQAQADLELKNKQLDHTITNDGEKLKLESKRVDLESLQLSYPSGGNTEIRNS